MSQIFTNGNKGDYEIKRGEIYYILQGDVSEEVGSEQRSGRPGIIVSNNSGNKFSNCVEVVLLTTRPKTDLPTHVKVNTSQYPSIAMCEQIKTYSKERLGDYIGTISADEQFYIDNALAISLDLPATGGDIVENDRLKDENNALHKALQDMEYKYMTALGDVESLQNEVDVYREDKKKEEVQASANAQKYKIERDVYKKMYEQLLQRVLTGNEGQE